MIDLDRLERLADEGGNDLYEHLDPDTVHELVRLARQAAPATNGVRIGIQSRVHNEDLSECVLEKGTDFAAINLNTEFTPIESAPDPRDWSKPARAVIASDGKGNGCVLHHVGAHIEQWAEDMSWALKDLGLDDAPCGISIWEGKTRTSRDYWGEVDAWLEGEFREPTSEEWDFINSGDCPWNEDEWMLPSKDAQ